MLASKTVGRILALGKLVALLSLTLTVPAVAGDNTVSNTVSKNESSMVKVLQSDDLKAFVSDTSGVYDTTGLLTDGVEKYVAEVNKKNESKPNGEKVQFKVIAVENISDLNDVKSVPSSSNPDLKTGEKAEGNILIVVSLKEGKTVVKISSNDSTKIDDNKISEAVEKSQSYLLKGDYDNAVTVIVDGLNSSYHVYEQKAPETSGASTTTHRGIKSEEVTLIVSYGICYLLFFFFISFRH